MEKGESIDHLTQISPLDGRYGKKLEELSPFFSESALVYYRIRVELLWLLHMDEQGINVLTENSRKFSKNILERSWKDSLGFIADIKTIEARTNHDVKAVEVGLGEALTAAGGSERDVAFLHFSCTSEDINNLAYALMVSDFRKMILNPLTSQIIDKLTYFSRTFAATALLSRTHGQAASPTTLGKEMAVFAYRLSRQKKRMMGCEILGKFSGAVGAFNAHHAAFPDLDWQTIAKNFVEEKIGVIFNPLTTQIESHDWTAEFLDDLKRFNAVCLNISQDFWAYISLGYFRLALKEGEVGSSTMPHKVNPIDFENAEGNFGLSSSLANHLSQKLQISRLQRDLSDSTAMRSLGAVFGYSVLAWKSLLVGLDKVAVDELRISEDLRDHWEVLAEPVQTILRKYGDANAYEKLKKLTRGASIDQNQYFKIIDQLKTVIGAADYEYLRKLTPQTYIGLAKKLAANCSNYFPV